MTDGLKERPAALTRRKPRPAADESVDPVDYTPGPIAPVRNPVQPQAAPAFSEVASGGVAEEVAPVAGEPEVLAVPVPQIVPTTESIAASVPQAAQPEAVPRTAPRMTKASKAAGTKKTSRREVTYPFSTRLSQDVMDVLYAASDAEDISVREAVEQAILNRWQ